jgi:nucleoside-diphosphate-sugar epimerase
MIVFLTGASGFIGSHVAEYFCRMGCEVRCLVRKNSDLAFLATLPVKLVYGDLSDLYVLDTNIQGSDVVIHTAALARDWGKKSDFIKTNVDGTLNVLSSCMVNGISTIIITGSISSYGEENFKGVKNESSSFNSHYNYFLDSIFPSAMNFYRDSKAIATIKAMQYAKKHKLNLTILEPVWVFGEREKNTGFFEYVKTVQSGMRIMPGSRKNKFHVVYAADLARAYFLTAEKKISGVHRIIVGNQEVPKMNDVFDMFCTYSGLKAPLRIPKIFVYPIAFLMELWASIKKADRPPLLTRARVNMFYDSIEYSVDKAEKTIGFTNQYSLDEAIEKTIKNNSK